MYEMVIFFIVIKFSKLAAIIEINLVRFLREINPFLTFFSPLQVLPVYKRPFVIAHGTFITKNLTHLNFYKVVQMGTYSDNSSTLHRICKD